MESLALSTTCGIVIASLVLFCLLILLLNFFPSRSVVDFSKKYILITGCDSGLGKLNAIGLDKRGFHVIATFLTKEGENELRSICSNRLTTLALDVTNQDQVQQAYSTIVSYLPRNTGLWGLVNNAGVLNVGPVDWQPLSTFKRTADVNLWGLIDVTKTFLPLIKKAKGRVVNMGSSCGRITLPYLASYCITKYGVKAFTDALRREMQPFGVLVINIEAGAHRTKLLSGQLLSEQWKKLWGELDETKQKEYGEESLTEGAAEMLRFDTITSSKTSAVTDTIAKALTAAVPKSNYIVGLDAKAFTLTTLLPTRLVDWLIRIMIKPLRPSSH